MSREWVLKTLVSLGLSQVEAEVYFFLAQASFVKGKDITKTLKLHKRQVYRSLKSLRAKGMIQATRECPARFSAVSIEESFCPFYENKDGTG